MRRRLLLACLVTTAALAGGGCRVDVGLDLQVEGDGTGTVDVVVALDEAAARRVPDLADQLEVDDLVASGWEITGPAPVDGGGVEALFYRYLIPTEPVVTTTAVAEGDVERTTATP